MDAFANALSLYKEVSSNNAAGLADARSQLRNLLSTVSGSIEKLTDFRSTVDGVPRMSSDLNRAKRALSGQLGSIVDEFNNVLRTVENIMQSIDAMISGLR
jgi:flagellar hook-associated protein FlgK